MIIYRTITIYLGLGNLLRIKKILYTGIFSLYRFGTPREYKWSIIYLILHNLFYNRIIACILTRRPQDHSIFFSGKLRKNTLHPLTLQKNDNFF